MTISRNISVLAQGANSSGILSGGYGGLGASVSPTTAGNVLFTADGSVWSSTQKIVRGTSVSASGAAIDFTGIPSWVKRVTIMLNGISTNGTSLPLIQLGTSSGVTTSGYTSGYSTLTGSVTGTSTTGFVIGGTVATNTLYGNIIITNISGNIWEHSMLNYNGSSSFTLSGGGITLAAVLDRVRLTTTNGTDNFDAGSVNILYE